MYDLHGETVHFDTEHNRLLLLDQTELPNKTVVLSLSRLEDMVEAIYNLRVRGAPAIGVMVRSIVAGILHPQENPDFISTRTGILNPKHLSEEQYAELIKEKPAYGNIVCRCEMVTEGEIIDAIHRPLGAKSLDGIKRRTRAGFGRCQAGFCSPKIMDILSRELGISQMDITKCGSDSKLIVDVTKSSVR